MEELEKQIQQTRQSRIRLTIISGMLGILFVIIAYMYAQVMLAPSEEDIFSYSKLAVERGPIVDRNGVILALQTELPTVTIWTPQVENPGQTAEILGTILDIDPSVILNRIKSIDGDVIIKRTISLEESDAISLLQQQGELRGVYLRKDVGRSYPNESLAAPILGFTGIDNIGLEGLEFKYNDILSPSPEDETKVYGNQIALTIDAVIQAELELVASRLVDQHDADLVMILAADATNGDILGMAQSPSFNPNYFQDSDPEQRKNLAISHIYEPGSVFKIISISSLLELGVIDESSSFNTSGSYQNDQMDDFITDLGNYGFLDPRGIITYSSNVGAAFASDSSSASAFHSKLEQYGFGSRSQIDLPGEEPGLFSDPSRWSGRSKPTIAIGQEIGVTAIQMIQAATAIANNGIMLRPQIIHQIISPSGQILEEPPKIELQRVLSEENAFRMRSYMNSATKEGGTARRARINGIEIGVKTGTAEMIDPETGTYSNKAFIASSLALFPYDEPEIILYVVIEYPKGDNFLGGIIAAPVIKELGEFLIPYLGIKQEGVETIEQEKEISISIPSLPIIEERLPDFTGLPLRTVLPLFEEERFLIQIHGSGYVINQSPPPGVLVYEDMTIHLYMSQEDTVPSTIDFPQNDIRPEEDKVDEGE